MTIESELPQEWLDEVESIIAATNPALSVQLSRLIKPDRESPQPLMDVGYSPIGDPRVHAETPQRRVDYKDSSAPVLMTGDYIRDREIVQNQFKKMQEYARSLGYSIE